MKEERGSSMLEMLGVISIIAVLGMGVWTLIGSAFGRFRLSQGVIQLQSLEKNITRFYASAGNYNELADTDAVKKLIENNVIPYGMAAGENALRNAFGGEVVVQNVPYSDVDEYGSSSDSFTITFKELKKSECREMALISWNEGDTVDLVSIKVGDDKFVWPSLSHSENDKVLPISAGTAMEICEAAPIDISWEFR